MKKLRVCLWFLLFIIGFAGYSAKIYAAETKSIDTCEVKLQNTSFTYSGTEIAPEITVFDGVTQLEKNKDFEVLYENNINACDSNAANHPAVIVKGKGNYTGVVKVPFTISKGAVTLTQPMITKTYQYTAGSNTAVEKVELPINEWLPAKRGVTTLSAVSSDISIVDKVEVSKEGTLSYVVLSGTKGKTADITVTAQMQNYADTSMKVQVVLADTGKETTVKKGAKVAAGTGNAKGTYLVTSVKTGKRTVSYCGPVNKKLTKVVIPKTVSIAGKSYQVTAIEKNAFTKCKKIKKIQIKALNIKTIGKNALKGLSKNVIIEVPAKKKQAYKKLLTPKTGYKKQSIVKK